jgi:ribosome maturation factor RimP
MDDTERLLRIEDVVGPVLASHGLDLVDAEWRREGRRYALRLFVDKVGGVGIQDCQRVSHEAGDVLDASGLITEGYDLEVSSPGLDRHLRKDREFRWAVGKHVRFWLRRPIDGRTELAARLTGVASDAFTVEAAGGPLALPRDAVQKARLEADVPWPRQAS